MCLAFFCPRHFALSLAWGFTSLILQMVGLHSQLVSFPPNPSSPETCMGRQGSIFEAAWDSGGKEARGSGRIAKTRSKNQQGLDNNFHFPRLHSSSLLYVALVPALFAFHRSCVDSLNPRLLFVCLCKQAVTKPSKRFGALPTRTTSKAGMALTSLGRSKQVKISLFWWKWIWFGCDLQEILGGNAFGFFLPKAFCFELDLGFAAFKSRNMHGQARKHFWSSLDDRWTGRASSACGVFHSFTLPVIATVSPIQWLHISCFTHTL